MSQTLPTYSSSAAFKGYSGWKVRHKAVLPLTPSGGDYGATAASGGGEQDVDAGGNAIAYAEVVVIANPNGQLVPSGSVYNGVSNGYQQISAATMQTATAPTIPAGTKWMVIEPEAGNVRWRDDGTSPTTAIGSPVYVGQQLIYAATDASGNLGPNLKLIDQDANGILNINYYK